MLLLLLCAAHLATGLPLEPDDGPETCGFASCPVLQPDVLNIHIVPHTHDDVGWLKTVDQYYYGSRNNIQKAGVQYILDSVVKELWENPARRFIYVETFFFWKWWTRQPEQVRSKVRALVRQGRLQFVGGAWSMNDEAAAHYQSTVDQFTHGLSKLNETFGKCGMPRVGWQIDPFGHSREFASLLAGMGYRGLFLGRIDYQDKSNRLDARTMESVWRGDDDLGNSSDIFTGVLFNTYSPPPGFCFDVLCSDAPIVDDINSPEYNVDIRIKEFLKLVERMADPYRSLNLLVTMGDDFQYQSADLWFTNLDKLIKYTNLKAAKEGLKVKLMYSTPDCYLKAVKDAGPSLPVKQDDFFPYASDPTAYWTGYFTSRPTTKYFERLGNAYLQMSKQLQVLADLKEDNMFAVNELKSAMGIMQHHDAITGTEKQHVTHDYERILHQAIENALIVPKEAFNKFMKSDALPHSPQLEFTRCRLNESSCSTSENSDNFIVTVYNHLAWNVNESIRIPVSAAMYSVYAPNGDKITSQIVDIPVNVINIPTRESIATHEIVFIAYLHPMSYKSFYIVKEPETVNKISKREASHFAPKRKKEIRRNVNEYFKHYLIIDPKVAAGINVYEKSSNSDIARPSKLPYEEPIEGADPNSSGEMVGDDPIVITSYPEERSIENQYIKLRYNGSSGYTLQAVLSDLTEVKLNITYHCYFGASRGRPSGAYILRPAESTPLKTNLKYFRGPTGPVVNELRSLSTDNVASTLRLYDGLDFIENDWLVGPIDVSDDTGKEYIVKYNTDIKNKRAFYTDSNGRQMLKRRLYQRPQWNVTLVEPVPGNYYPVTNKIFIQDGKLKTAVFTDRSEGGTSINEGEIELMLHRRLLYDDGFGVAEPLNESANNKGLVVRGRHRIYITKSNDKDAHILEKKRVLEFHLQPSVFIANARGLSLTDWLKMRNGYSWINSLPLGLHLLTLEPWGANKLLLRLENYLELADLEASTIEIDLKSIFRTITLLSYKETTLAANHWVKEEEPWQWRKDGEFVKNFNDAYGSNAEGNTDQEETQNNQEETRNNQEETQTNTRERYDVYTSQDDSFTVQLKAKEIRTFIVEFKQGKN